MGCGASSKILRKYKLLTPYTPDQIAKHGPTLIGTEVHIVGYVGLCENNSKKHVVYSPFNRDEYGVYIKINVYAPGYNGRKSKNTFTGKAGIYFTLHNNKFLSFYISNLDKQLCTHYSYHPILVIYSQFNIQIKIQGIRKFLHTSLALHGFPQ